MEVIDDDQIALFKNRSIINEDGNDGSGGAGGDQTKRVINQENLKIKIFNHKKLSVDSQMQFVEIMRSNRYHQKKSSLQASSSPFNKDLMVKFPNILSSQPQILVVDQDNVKKNNNNNNYDHDDNNYQDNDNAIGNGNLFVTAINESNQGRESQSFQINDNYPQEEITAAATSLRSRDLSNFKKFTNNKNKTTKRRTESDLSNQREDFQFYKEKRKQLEQQNCTKKGTRFALRQSIEAIVKKKDQQRKQVGGQAYLYKKQDSLWDGGKLNGYNRNKGYRKQDDQQQPIDFIKQGEDILKMLRQRNVKQNITQLQREIKLITNRQNKRGFSFSQALREIRDQNQYNQSDRKLTEKEKRINNLNSFLQKYQDKFSMGSVNLLGKSNSNGIQDSLIDYDEFFESKNDAQKILGVGAGLKEQIRNLHKQTKFKERSKSIIDDETEQKVEQMYNDLISKKKSQENLSQFLQNSRLLNQSESRYKIMSTNNSKPSLFNPFSNKGSEMKYSPQMKRGSVGGSGGGQSINLKIDQSLKEIRQSFADLALEFKGIGGQIDVLYKQSQNTQQQQQQVGYKDQSPQSQKLGLQQQQN